MLSIIITHHQTPVLLKLCLKSIRENIGHIEHELIVVDSESKVEIQEQIQEEFPDIKFISFPANVGYAKAVNAGLKESQGEYILILNADIIVLKEAIGHLLKFIQDHPQVGIVGPQLLTFTNTIQDSCFRFPTPGAILARRTFLGKTKWGKRKIAQFLIRPSNSWELSSHWELSSQKNPDERQGYPVDWLQGSAMLVRKTALEKVGLMDERFFIYLEDADWCRRFWQNGWSVVHLPLAQMAHYYYRTSRKWGGFLDLFLNRYTRMHLISAMKYFWKWRKINSKLKVQNSKLQLKTQN